jgi:ATP-dependent Lon protease
LDPQTRQPIFTTPPKAGELGKNVKVVDGKAYQVVMENGEEVLRPMKGQEEKMDDSPRNPVDQYIFANSPYKNMAEAKAAGAHDLVKQAEQVVREQRPLDRAREQASIITEQLPKREREAQQIKLEAPLPQEKRANLFDRKAFLEGKNVRLPPGTTEGAAARADVIEITDKQMEDIKTLDNATADMQTLFSMGDRLITAKDWKEANFKQFLALKGGAFTGVNSEAATYEKDVQAFSTNLARAFGHEKGVMTDQDIARWVATIPTFRDTVKTKEAKKAIFNEIKGNALRAQRRAIAGDDLNAVRSELQQSVQPLLKKADALAGKSEAPPVPEKFKHLPKEDQDRWQQAYMERMQEMGAMQ